MKVTITPMGKADIPNVASIHPQQFTRQSNSEEWISCNFAAFPRIMIFVARSEADQVVGYIQAIYMTRSKTSDNKDYRRL